MNPLDPQELYRLARRLDDHADAIRTRAHRLSLGVSALAWHSPAADAFRDAVSNRVHGLHVAAGAVEAAARRLRAHARVVEVEQAAVLAAAHAVALAAAEARRVESGVLHAGAGVLDAMGDWL